MHKNIDKIKNLEGSPKIIKKLFSKNEIEKFLELYKNLPTTVHNKKQNVIKKRWLKNFNEELERLYFEKVRNEIGDFKMDNLKDEKGEDIYGLFQESYNPIGLHIDGGFNFEDQIYKQTLIPLTPVGSTVIFKNRYYGKSTNFTIDQKELEKKDLKYGQNIRSKDHIGMFGEKAFDKEIHRKFLSHEKIDNLVGLEVELIYNWEVGSLLTFDRSSLHCSSSVIDGKKIGLTTFTKR